ncbi:MAG: hypothetical protein QOF78_2354 [Phycisphaerales bacterium]|jgi:flagellar basal body-associated protein FliL|nr:hypothetical protein [Phycisphaerales bacterium]
MSRQPIEYATPERREPQRLSQGAKWILIVLGLVLAAVVTFVMLFIGYIRSIGPLDSH